MSDRLDKYARLAMLLAALIGAIAVLLLTGCGAPRPRIQAPVAPSATGPSAGAGALGYIGYVSTALGGVAFIVGVIGLIFASNKYKWLQTLIAAVTLIISGSILAFVGAHLVGITVAVLCVGLAAGLAYAFAHRKRLITAAEELTGLDLPGNDEPKPGSSAGANQ